jgi:hypothetical protein
MLGVSERIQKTSSNTTHIDYDTNNYGLKERFYNTEG